MGIGNKAKSPSSNTYKRTKRKGLREARATERLEIPAEMYEAEHDEKVH